MYGSGEDAHLEAVYEDSNGNYSPEVEAFDFDDYAEDWDDENE